MYDLKCKDSSKLTDKDYEEIAKLLKCEINAIKAVVKVESAGGGFNKDSLAKILFEPHIFSKQTSGKYDTSHPNISSKKWNKALYKDPYKMLEEATKLNEDAALKSASYGAFQVLGTNYKVCGYKSIDEFVKDISHSEKKQLEIFAKFILANKIEIHLQKKDWVGLAKAYNGPGFKKNKYDVKLEQAYKDLCKK